MIVLSTVANEQSVYWITVNLWDDDGTAMDNNDLVLTWTLTDLSGNLINSREDVSVSSPTDEETIELSGADLAVDGNDIVQRIMTLEGTYDSKANGDDKPFKFQIKFPIQPVVIV